jgi:hypothetical protein
MRSATLVTKTSASQEEVRGDRSRLNFYPSGKEPHHFVMNAPVRGKHVVAVEMEGTTLHIADATAGFHN